MSIRLFLTPFALAGALLGASVAAFAQAEAPPAPAPAAAGAPQAGMHRPHAKMRAALATLNLSSDQRAQIEGFMKSFHDSRRTATPETRKQLIGQIEGVLTPDQQTAFETALHAPAPAAQPQPQ
ncbi:MAG: hypothetical protein IAI48_01570 [Candidatus Eremiobacteraeota bacterium]|nr:hypothetical protein [Candidatus Eremiobacteraeota bacterium]